MNVKVIMLCLLFFTFGCKEEPEVKKPVEIQPMSTEDPAPQDDTKLILHQADTLLREWNTAHQSGDHGVIHAREKRLQQLTQKEFSTFANALKRKGSDDQAIAAAALGFSEKLQAIPPLMETMQTGNAMVRSYSAMSIGHIGLPSFSIKPSPIKTLLKRLKEDPNNDVRGTVAFAIFRIVKKDKDYGTLPFLLQTLKDKAPQVRAHVVLALGKIGGEESSKAIIATCLNDKVQQVRNNSIIALGKIGEKEAIGPIIEKLRDPVLGVKVTAFQVLKDMTKQDFGMSYDKWHKWHTEQ